MPNLFEAFAPLHELANEVAAVSIWLKHAIYDCFYLALAWREAAPLVTADRRLAVAAQALPDFEVPLVDVSPHVYRDQSGIG